MKRDSQKRMASLKLKAAQKAGVLNWKDSQRGFWMASLKGSSRVELKVD